MLIIVFWSIAFMAISSLLVVYRLGLTSFEPIVSLLVLVGLTAVLSIIFHQIGGKRATHYRYTALRKIFGRAGIITIAVWLVIGGVLGYFLFREPPKTIKIGIDLPLTGDEGAKGVPLLAGMYQGLAEERQAFKEATGYSLEFVIKDDAQDEGSFDAQKGANNIESLITNSKVAAVLGPYNTDVALKAIPIVNQHHVALLSSTTTSNCLTAPQPQAIDAAKLCSTALQDEYDKKTRAFFRLTAPNNEIANVVLSCLGKNIATSLCATTTKYSKLVILRDDSTYGAELAVQLAEKWRASTKDSAKTLLDYTNSPVNDGMLTDEMKAEISKLASADAPVLVFFAGTKQLETLYDGIRHLPYTAFASNSSLTNSTFTAYLDNLQITNPLFASSGDQSIDRGSVNRGANKRTQTGVEDFVAAYQQGYKPNGKLAKELQKNARKNHIELNTKLFNADSVSPASATSYDAARILILAIKKAIGQIDETDREANPQKFHEAIITNLRGMEQGSQYTYKGVTGTYSGFEADGDIKDYTPVSIYEYQSGADPRWRSR